MTRCACLSVISFSFTTGAVEAFLMVCSSLASHFQGGIIFLMNMKVLLGTHLCNLGFPGSWCLQWPCCGVHILLSPPLWGLLPSSPTSSQCHLHSTIYTGVSFLPPILASHFLLPFSLKCFPSIPPLPFFFCFERSSAVLQIQSGSFIDWASTLP